MTKIRTYSWNNINGVYMDGTKWPEHAISITAKTEEEATAILSGLDGGRSFNMVRDEALRRYADEVRDATAEEIADYLHT